MTIWQSLFLGIIQGITEFLPVSSSGHLVIIQRWFGLDSVPLFFDLFLHLMSVIAMIIFLQKKILKLNIANITHLIFATLPISIVGLLFQTTIKTWFNEPWIAGVGLLVTAFFNFLAARFFLNQKNNETLTNKKALTIGLFQAVAIAPGISRSGSTLFGASLVNLDKQTAFDFSFLMAIIAVVAASFADLIDISPQELSTEFSTQLSTYLFGGMSCLVTSLLSLKLLQLTLAKTHYHWFGWYCFIFGLLTLIIF